MSTKKWTQTWHQEQVTAYRKDLPAYTMYARLMRKILAEVCRRFVGEGHAFARAKELTSFAEKAIRNYDKSPDPIHEFTDLCGGRVVVLTQAEADKAVEFVRQNFLIDEENSEDVRKRLAPDKFGYRAVHFVVQMPWCALLGRPNFKAATDKFCRRGGPGQDLTPC